MSTMEKVAILARVSTQGQDYERQVVELTDYCQRMNWGGREGVRQQGQRSHEKLDLVLYQLITKPLKIKNQDKSCDLSCLVDDTGKISNLLEDFRKVEEFIKSIDAHSSTISQ